MHFKSLLFVDLPPVQSEPDQEMLVQKKIEELASLHSSKAINRLFMSLGVIELNSKRTAFGTVLTEKIHDIMERFCYETRNPKYLEFDDRTKEYKTDFEKSIDCVKTPDGKIWESNEFHIRRNFIIKNGKVYQKVAGQLQHPKRTKKAKKMKALPGYPRKKLYSSFDAFVESMGGCRNEKTGKYGEWYNPYGMCDWYSIGGRWPEMFLVKLDCQEYSYGEVAEIDLPAPDGYRWVACARKRDIQWDAMRQWCNQQAEERYHEMKARFQNGNDFGVYKVTEDGIQRMGRLIYRKDQTLEEYLDEFGYSEKWKYPISVCGIFRDENYYAEGEVILDADGQPSKHLSWQEVQDIFIDDADDDTVFVGIDYHM